MPFHELVVAVSGGGEAALVGLDGHQGLVLHEEGVAATDIVVVSGIDAEISGAAAIAVEQGELPPVEVAVGYVAVTEGDDLIGDFIVTESRLSEAGVWREQFLI